MKALLKHDSLGEIVLDIICGQDINQWELTEVLKFKDQLQKTGIYLELCTDAEYVENRAVLRFRQKSHKDYK